MGTGGQKALSKFRALGAAQLLFGKGTKAAAAAAAAA
eukprot:CAMPEP_0198694484 /NCGR_PEP_ID=MMETSP1468-20131203/270412_1 /TAXON_ID=1461545 /ORGANISM="Mantoniella sp, Strain CCMP1436" /LENGTH=36 /DNA_ID= /DNA_START= /DNA_END= /DNA_ORIENTATION=